MPFVKAIVPEVDVAGRPRHRDAPAGLFEDLPAEDGDEEPRRCRSPRHPLTRAIPQRPDVRIDVVSIFPSFFDVLEVSLLGKARGSGLLDVRVHDLRDWTHDRHRTVDDTPYGGGAGMVMKPEPWGEALDAIAADAAAPSDPSSSSRRPPERCSRRRPRASSPSAMHLVFGCGRYEGIDERVFDTRGDARRACGS